MSMAVFNNGVKFGYRVANWNITRGLDYWASDLSTKILSEEVREFWLAYTNKSIVDMLDAYADVRFVYEGRMFLFAVHKWNSIEELTKAKADFDILMDYAASQMHAMLMILDNIGLRQHHLDDIFSIVCDANDKKHSEKNGDGKITKGPDWYKPEGKIEEYFDKLNLKVEFK